MCVERRSWCVGRKETRRSYGSLMLLAALLLAAIGPAAGQEDAMPKLFTYVGENKQALTPKQERILDRLRKERTAVRVEPVRLNTKAFQSDKFLLHLGDASWTATRTQSDKTPDGFTWKGRLSGDELELPVSAQFLVQGDHASGSFSAGKFDYEVRSLGGGVQAIIQRDSSNAPPDHPPEFKEIERKGGKKPAKDAIRGDELPPGKAPPVKVSIMILYTPAVEQVHADIDQDAQSLVKLYANDTYHLCYVPLELELVRVEPVNYKESGSLARDLERLVDPHDGAMDGIHSARNVCKADLVVLLVDNGDGAGYSAAIQADADTAFAVVVDQYATWYYSFAHEIGHLLGGRHNPQEDPDPTPYAWGHGFLQDAKRWRTIMSYDGPQRNCKRLGIWSNPKVKVNGAPAGTPGLHYDAKVLSDEASRVAGFR